MPVILHAHPTGPLRDSLDGMWSNFEQRGRPTSAQQWLPHVTVTNSLRLSSGEKAELTNSEIENLARILENIVSKFPESTRNRPHLNSSASDGSWCGLTVACPEWIEIGKEYKTAVYENLGYDCTVERSLHLSIAYDDGYDASYHDSVVNEFLRGVSLASDDWSLGLWSPHNGVWTSHLLLPW